MRTVGVGGVITNAAGEVLLVRTAKAGWELPGGRVESGEDLLGALQRELLEEAGCAASIGRVVGIYAHINQDLLIVIFRGTSSTDRPSHGPQRRKSSRRAGSRRTKRCAT